MADCRIDNESLICKFLFKLKQKNKANQFPHYNIEHIPNIFRENIKNHFEVLSLIDWEPEEVQNKIKEFVKNKCEKKLPQIKKLMKANWMSEQIENCQEEMRCENQERQSSLKRT